MNQIAVRYCSHPDGHAPADCPDLERDRLLARVARLEEALCMYVRAARPVTINGSPAFEAIVLPADDATIRAALAEKS